MSEYHNPQHDPGSERRLLFAFFLVFILIAVMQFFLPKPQPPAKPSGTPTPQAQQPQQSQQPQQAGEQAQATPSPSQAHAGRKTSASKPAVPAVTRQAANETETVFENDYYKITFTNHGAVAKSWLLKKYTDEKGNTLDLINQPGAAAMGYPLSLFSYDKDLQKTLNSAMYVASGTGKQNEVTFEYSQNGVYARKTFRTDVGYIIRVETEVEDQGQRVSVFPQWPGGLGDQVTPSAYAAGKIGWHRDGEIERKSATSGWFLTGKKWIAGGQTILGPFQWAALADQYFAMAMMPESPKDSNLVTFHEQIEIPRDPSKPNEAKDKVPLLGLAIGDVSGLTRQRIFAGPKAVDLLENTKAQPNGPDLRGILDFGTFGFIARPLFLWLKWTYEHWIPNWGWAISFLTLVITMALLPLRISAQKSQLKMQKIQPQMKAIQEKYKRYSITDPRRSDMQKEMSELYKREGVNPVGGCFPMLLQMPFLFAFYSMLGNAIELRHASWLWIRDLSAPDPFHILPILIVISMFITQKSMPQAGMDPAQQKMMNVMGPLMIGGISWGVAAGLCVYWAISNLLGYVQQTLINRSELGQQVRKTVERRATRKR